MSWWEALLWTAGIIGFWPALLVGGDWVGLRLQRRADQRLRGSAVPRTIIRGDDSE
jgi:hypothetical protein